MSKTTWADVAHYYVNSGIQVEYPDDLKKNGKRRAFLTGVTTTEMETTYRRREKRPSGGYCVGDLLGWEKSRNGNASALDTKPILRHLEDMTEEEAQQLCDLEFGEGWVDGDALQYLRDAPDSKSQATLHDLLGSPTAWLWLIKNGFDIFGLIEDGEAIRK